MFFCEYSEISNNTYFEEHLRTAAPENNNKKRFRRKVTGHNDHYIINMGGQRPKIGGNWPLTGAYLQYCLNKEVSDEVEFLLADKDESLLQIDTIIFDGDGQGSQNSKFAMSLRYLKKKWEMNLIFCIQFKIKVSYKLVSTLWTLKFPRRWYYHYWWTWANILKVLKVTRLQCL